MSSPGGSDGESSDSEIEGSETEEEPRTPDGQDKHKKDNKSDDDKCVCYLHHREHLEVRAVKAMKVKRDKTVKKAEQNKQTAREERKAPFTVSVVLPDGTVKELEINKTMTVGGLRLQIGTRLMKTTKQATKSLRLVHGVDEMTAGSMRKTVGSFAGMGEHSRILVSLT